MAAEDEKYRGYRVVMRRRAWVGGQRYMLLTVSSRSSARSLMIQLVVTMYWKEQKALSTL